MKKRKPRKGDRHSPGYMREYMRRWRAALKAAATAKDRPKAASARHRFDIQMRQNVIKILALDLAEYRLGYAHGLAGGKPEVGIKIIRHKDERTEEAVATFARWLHGFIKPFDLVVAENYLPAGAMQGRTTSGIRDGAILFAGALRGVCAISDVEVRVIYPATIRKHFCGQAHGTDRADTKRMVIARAQQLGYIPRSCDDDDMADAVALWDFASSHFGRAPGAFELT